MLVLATTANPGSATWLETTLGSATPGLVFWVDGSLSLSGANGTAAAPFATIQEALDAAGTPDAGDPIDGSSVYTIFVASGVYDEALTIPDYRSVNIVALGYVFLGSTGGVAKSITIAQSAVIPNPGIGQIVSIRNQAAPYTRIVVDQILVSSLGAGDLALVLDGALVRGTSGAGIDATLFTGGGSCTLQLLNSNVNTDDPLTAGVACISGPSPSPNGTELVLDDVRNSRVESRSAGAKRSVRASSYRHIESCLFDHDLTFVGNPDGFGAFSSSGTQPVGFFTCDFGNALNFTGTAALDFHIDAASNFAFKSAVGTITAPSTKHVIADTVP